MKVLLDETFPNQLRRELPGHEVSTLIRMGWSGIGNVFLLDLAAQYSFDVLVTSERGLDSGRDPANLPLAVIVVDAKPATLEALRPLLPELLALLGRLGPREFARLGAS